MSPTITNQAISPAPIRKSIHVATPPARAFSVFTADVTRWWLKTHTISKTKSPIAAVVIEPHAGGLWYERGEDGSECQWGKVLAWEPPTERGGRLLLAWQINAQWQFDPAFQTEVEIRFTPDGSGTLVELEHRQLERFGEGATAMAEGFTGGWGKLLESFAQAAA